MADKAVEASEQDIINFYLDMRREGMGERQAARALGVSHREIMAYAEAVPSFKMALEDALIERIEAVEHKVYEAGQAGDITAAKMVLESHLPAEWTKPTPEMLVKVQRDEPMTLEEVNVLRQKLEAAKHKAELDAGAIEVEASEDA